MTRFNIYLMGYRGLECIKHLISKGYSKLINKVIVERDTAIKEDYFKDITTLCSDNNITWSKRNELVTIGQDDDRVYSLAISWRWMLDVEKLFIFHDSILPRYRGFSPLVSQLINKESTVGVTLLLSGSRVYDSGPIISQSTCNIEYPITIYDAIKKTTSCYLDLIDYIFSNVASIDSVIKSANAQKENDATYSLWRDIDDYKIDWNNNADYIERFINATGFPYNGAESNLTNEKVYITEGIACKEDLMIENRTPGKVLMLDQDKYPIVVCGSGLLKVTKCHNREGQSLFPGHRKFRLRFK